ncbi:MAG: GerMN domain-containing protein, partial [Deltaproteobacteria bacterium]|nr:GerMN domain-containing protein [Deltaproteobacteria bacterium]
TWTRQRFPESPSLPDRLRQVLEILSQETGKKPGGSLCPGLRWRQVYFDYQGTAFIDLAAPPANTSGLNANGERLCLWAIINTVCFNFPEIKSVKFLVDGQEAAAVFGHIDLSWPLWPDKSLIEDQTSGH